jgi:SM-20-related protein
MSALHIALLDATPLATEPFEYVIVPGFVRPEFLRRADADFPKIKRPGSFPLSMLQSGGAFRTLIGELEGPEMRAVIERKFGVDLTDRPTMVTVRGHCRESDGGIHTDSVTKIITVLIYFNHGWGADGGRLRMLRSATDIEDFAAEVPPDGGTLLAFRRSDTSFHGHKPFAGPRRSIQLNWVTGPEVVRRELSRHKLSALTKALNPFA